MPRPINNTRLDAASGFAVDCLKVTASELSDSADQVPDNRIGVAVYATGAGVLRADMQSRENVELPLKAGEWRDGVLVTRLRATGTTNNMGPFFVLMAEV